MNHRKPAFKFFSVLLSFVLLCSLFSSCGDDASPAMQDLTETGTTEESGTTALPVSVNGVGNRAEFRGVWLSYSEIGNLIAPEADGFYQTLFDRFSSLAQWGFTTVIFHARAFGDAFYASEYFPWSSYLTGTQGVSPGYDPLEIAVQAAHDANLDIHAWINPYRVSYQTDIQSLSASNPARLMAENGKTENLLLTESGIYYNPASLEVQELVLNGIREIIARYAVDGIHIDDYFYPTDTGSADMSSFLSYVQSGGSLTLEDWRRANVSALVSGMYAAVHAQDEDLCFGISPGGVFDTNYNTYYADVETWIASGGYCDYIIPQIYFGFENNSYPYEMLLQEWSTACTASTVDLYIGLALYKTGMRDTYAGSEQTQNEWLNHSDIIARQIQALRGDENCSGFALFSFGDLFSAEENEIRQAEVQHLLQLLDGEE